jgi:hypothetical protein
VVVILGEALTVEAVILSKPLLGVHKYEVAPEALRVVAFPLHIAVFGELVRLKLGDTKTAIVFEAEQPLLLPVTV